MSDLTPEQLQDRIAKLSGEVNTVSSKLSESKREVTKLNTDLLVLFQEVTKLRRNDGS